MILITIYLQLYPHIAESLPIKDRFRFIAIVMDDFFLLFLLVTLITVRPELINISCLALCQNSATAETTEILSIIITFFTQRSIFIPIIMILPKTLSTSGTDKAVSLHTVPAYQIPFHIIQCICRMSTSAAIYYFLFHNNPVLNTLPPASSCCGLHHRSQRSFLYRYWHPLLQKSPHMGALPDDALQTDCSSPLSVQTPEDSPSVLSCSELLSTK